MKIELDDKTREAVMKAATDRAIEGILDQLNLKQIAGEVKNEVVRRLADKISSDVMKQANVSQAIERSIKSVENQVNLRVFEALQRGFTVRLADEVIGSKKKI